MRYRNGEYQPAKADPPHGTPDWPSRHTSLCRENCRETCSPLSETASGAAHKPDWPAGFLQSLKRKTENAAAMTYRKRAERARAVCSFYCPRGITARGGKSSLCSTILAEA